MKTQTTKTQRDFCTDLFCILVVCGEKVFEAFETIG